MNTIPDSGTSMEGRSCDDRRSSSVANHAVFAVRAFHPLRVKRVALETAEACSIVFAVPPELSELFAYEAGQFVNVRVVVDGDRHVRSYSMSSSPAIDADLQIMVKRVPGGLVSNWLNDTVIPGAVLDVGPPTGAFVLGESDRDIVAFAAGSGITPVFSILKTALRSTRRRVRLLYANRDRAAAIFASELDALVERYPGRVVVEHHEDVQRGFVGGHDVASFADGARDADFYVCGPTPFMDVVETALRDGGADVTRLHLERFTLRDGVHAIGEPRDEAPGTTNELTLSIDGRAVTLALRRNTTLLECARLAGLRPPASCEIGSCGACIARIVEGRVEMRSNEVLTSEEVAEGWVLTCQAVPVTSVVSLLYE
jgi:ferredoxin-NADP reductase